MLPSIPSLGKQLPPESPSLPTVTVTGVRIPADGTPAHLLSLATTTPSGATDDFLFHISNFREYWGEPGWKLRDIHRLELQQLHQLLQPYRLLEIYHPWKGLHLKQRCFVSSRRHLLHHNHGSCAGAYYVFRSFAHDDLPQNTSVPKWVSEGGNSGIYWGDVFIFKVAQREYRENGWAAYEDVSPTFLQLLAKGPSPYALLDESECPTCRRVRCTIHGNVIGIL